MKFKNVLVCTMAILPMFCAIESQAGLAEEYNKAKLEERHNSEAYKNTQKLNEKQKDFLINVLEIGSWWGRNLVGLCFQETEDLKNCHDGKEGLFGWKFPIEKYDNKYISSVTVSTEGEKSIIEVKASSHFGEGVTLVLNCEAVPNSYGGEIVDCPISKKSTCLEKGLCSAGIFDVGDESTMIEIEYKIKD